MASRESAEIQGMCRSSVVCFERNTRLAVFSASVVVRNATTDKHIGEASPACCFLFQEHTGLCPCLPQDTQGTSN